MGSMYMCGDLMCQSLISTTYQEFWPVSLDEQDLPVHKTAWDRPSRRDVSCRPSGRLQDSQVVLCSTLPQVSGCRPPAADTNDQGSQTLPELTTDEEIEMVGNLPAFSKLDKNTLQYLGWSSGALDNVAGNNLEEENNDDKEEKDIYRGRISDLLQKLYTQQPSPVENGSQLYRSQLAASLKAFKPKDWPPLKFKDIDSSFLRCKPINTQPERNPTPPPSRYTSPLRPRRPVSVPAGALRRPDTPVDVRPGNFDTLNPRMLARLMGDSRVAQTYGDIIPLNERLAETEDEETKTEKSEEKSKKAKDDENSTSGIESSQTDDDSGSSSDDEDSDFEPTVDRDRKVPDLVLRPEKLDSLVVPDSAKGWRKYDFDADNVEIPEYEFADPLPEPFRDIDLRQMARLKWNWRDQTKARPGDGCLNGILDRLVDLERLQIETEEWEQKRMSQINKRSKRTATAKNGNRDKRCCNKCLQPACVGDCPEKVVQSTVCEMCRQPLCVSSQCKETKYEQRMRLPRDDERAPTPKPPLPRACKSCQSKTNAKLINANNLILGRPKSGNVTFSRGQSSMKPRDLRPNVSNEGNQQDIIRDFEKLGLNSTQNSRQNSASRIQRPRSRNGMLPGKSFFSQRRDSLTEVDKEVAVINSRRMRKVGRTIKYRRPKTAV
ncbi:hypothetical protein FSP39_015604 [Pinctada imbricata]|uniref:Uncharacterized protein n=1 Tax=Pinctada imbricata TaxID=66713 RepID=A0AA89BXF6_PINIB|nr:hypothetical protein FSP39_015604 [Pinctada imbricata]